jgi:SAM-dependent methyltransferase
MSAATKEDVRDFWDAASCGETLYLNGLDEDAFQQQATARYVLEPYIADFAGFDAAKGKQVLEIGVGLGADHERFARAGAILTGVDLTPRAIEMTKRRFALIGLTSDLATGDAENLAFPDNHFDQVYSWGVIHHSPDTHTAAREILRVLKPGGHFSVMVYHRYSFIGYMLWLRYGLARLRPFLSLDTLFSRYLESPGTKAYSLDQAKALFAGATNLQAWTVLTHGDLLEGEAGQRHKGPILNFARKIWPRNLIKKYFPNHGLFLLIDGQKAKLRH